MLRLTRNPKRSKSWYLRGTVGGRFIYESSGTTDKAQAEEYRIKREREVYSEARLGTVRPATFADAVGAYLDFGKSDKYLKPLVKELGKIKLAKIGQTEVDRAANAIYPGRKASTLNRQVYGPVIAVLRHAAASRLEGATIPLIKHRKAQKPVIQPADDEHIAKLLPHCSEGLRALILLMTYTGLRTGEALRVKPEDIRGDCIQVAKTKNGKPRMVPVPSEWRFPADGFQFRSTQGVGRAIRRASRAAGIPYRDGHELGRHSFAARFLKAGGSIKALKEAGGWEKLAIVDSHYGHMELSDVHDFMRKLSERK